MSAPALTSRIWPILFRNEWFKARKRLAFWLALGFYGLITVGSQAGSWWQARNDPERMHTLPEAWSEVFGQDASVFLIIFACVSLILLSSSEFSWRTARQNVIDGLSKSQWFWGKSMLLPVLGLLYIVMVFVVGAVFGLLGTDPAAASGPMFPIGVLEVMGVQLLAFLAVGGLAFFIALAVRSSGGAMAVWFLWIFPMEQGIVPLLLGRIEAIRPYFQYQPFTCAMRLLSFEAYDAAAYERLVAAQRAAERPITPPPDVTTALCVTAGWAVLFIASAYIMFRKRDL